MSKEKEISEMRSLFLANKDFTVLFSLAPCDSAEQNNPVNCFARGRGWERGQIHECSRLRRHSVLIYAPLPRIKRASEPAD